jgi:citrate lyase beta subunit
MDVKRYSCGMTAQDADALASANREFARRYSGDRPARQPVHTVYGGGHLFRADTAPRLGAAARRALTESAASPGELARVLGIPALLAERVYALILDKLTREAVEDFRIDFEDGYGNRPDAEEDAHAAGAAKEVAEGMRSGTLPPYIGIRIKPLNEELRHRSLRTLELFLEALVSDGGLVPANFTVTLPKITIPEQVQHAAGAVAALEQRLGLEEGVVSLELMVEMPQAILDAEGRCPLLALVAAGGGRVRGAHFGTYDYTAGLTITAAHQRMRHPACDFAKHMMQVALAGSGVWLSDGATGIMPVARHRIAKGETLTDAQIDDNRAGVHRAWKLHYDDTRHSLEGGYYQGWDLHPAQLPSRYAAVFTFFLEGLDAAAQRLQNFLAKAAQATLVGDVFDDAATGQGLLNYFLRGVTSGAIPQAEAAAMTGLTVEELAGRSFVRILKNRAGRAG